MRFEVNEQQETFERLTREKDGTFVKETVVGHFVQAPDIFMFFACKNEYDRWEVRDVETGFIVASDSGHEDMEEAIKYTLLQLNPVTDNEFTAAQETAKNIELNPELDKNLHAPSILQLIRMWD